MGGCREREFTLRALVDELAKRGLKVDYRSVCVKFVHAETRALKKPVLASEQDRPNVARREFNGPKYQGRIDPSRARLRLYR